MALTDNVTAYFKFDNGAITTDSVGSYTLTNSGTAANTASGLIGYGVDLGATNSTKWLNRFAADTVDKIGVGTGTFSMSVWFKNAAEIASGTQTILHWFKWNGANLFQMYVQYQYNAGTRRLGMERYDAAGNVTTTSNQTLGTGWHHIVMLNNGASCELYLDGTSIATYTGSASPGSGGNSSGYILGGQPGSDFFSGFIDECCVWSRVLSGSEITTLYNGGAGLQYPFNLTQLPPFNKRLNGASMRASNY